MVYLLIGAFFAGGIVCALLWHTIVKILYACGMAIGIFFAWRIVTIVNDNALDIRPIFIGGISAFVVCILCSGYIRHALIYFYLQDTIERSKQAAQKGRLW